MRVIGACRPPGLQRTSKPDFSLATARLHVHGDTGNPSGWFRDAQGGSAVVSPAGSASWRAGRAGGGQHHYHRSQRVPRGLSRAREPRRSPHHGRKGRCTRAAFHSEGVALPGRSIGASAHRGSPRPSLAEQPRQPRAPERLRLAPRTLAGGTPNCSCGEAVPAGNPRETPRVHCTSPRLHAQLQLHLTTNTESSTKHSAN